MKIGLVLDGGGGKGAYQIGVWKAMRECGLDQQVKAVSGTSVGGLNAVLFVQGDYDLAERIWTKEISRIHRSSLQKDLEALIDQYIDFSAIACSPIDCFLASHSNGDPEAKLVMEDGGISIGKYVIGEMTYYNLRRMSKENCGVFLHSCSMPKAVMLASAALPLLCSKVQIGSRLYEDGGVPGGDNSPIYPIVWGMDCDTLIAVHLDTMGNIEKERYPDMNILEITPDVPQKDLGFWSGTLNFEPEYARRMLEAGYRDSMAAFQMFFRHGVDDVPTRPNMAWHPRRGMKLDNLKQELEKEDFSDLQAMLHTWTKG